MKKFTEFLKDNTKPLVTEGVENEQTLYLANINGKSEKVYILKTTSADNMKEGFVRIKTVSDGKVYSIKKDLLKSIEAQTNVQPTAKSSNIFAKINNVNSLQNQDSKKRLMKYGEYFQ